MGFKKVKPEKVNLTQRPNESKNAFKNRVHDAETLAYKKAAATNAEIAKKQGRNPSQDHGDSEEQYTSHQKRGRGRYSIGHHD